MLSGPQRLHVDLVVRWDRCRVHQDLEVTLLQQFIDAGAVSYTHLDVYKRQLMHYAVVLTLVFFRIVA